MKRMIVILLVLSMLIACVPTPEHEFIVNKGDSTVEDKINAVPKPAEDTVQHQGAVSENPVPPIEAPTQPQVFPDRWDEDTVQINDRVSISVHADVIQKADGLYPVYRTKDVLMSEERAQDSICSYLWSSIFFHILRKTIRLSCLNA